MLNEIDKALKQYQVKWDKLVDATQNQDFFRQLRPTAVGWKTVDLADYDRRFNELRELCDQIHLAWLNGRWLATLHLKDQKLDGGIQIIKLMQRRPDSTDTVGLDHLDFYSPTDNIEAILAKEKELKWTKEMNGEQCKWISVWFGDTEAKLRTNTVIDVCMTELETVNRSLTK